MKTATLPSGERIPALGQGTWNMGDSRGKRAQEIAALRRGIDLGLTLLDTAEMYGDGRSEQLIAEAIAGQRDAVFIVSKVLPGNASRRGTVAACERSLINLNTDRIDLYLLHWRGGVPFAETLEALMALQRAGKIRHYGVSNLDLSEMKAWCKASDGEATATNQLLYNLSRRGIEWDLLPWLRERRVPVMAYSPLEQARLLTNAKFAALAKASGITPAQMALAWLLAKENVIVIPKCSSPARMEENAAARDVTLTAAQMAELDKIFPPPGGPQALEML
ncbi:MAG TPA: aldo/keto reductase [Burkholderiales bacterium]|nr:aldo/keto reductase [Burkholderiales bacterium]